MDLDPVDVAILRALQEDARLSFRELARRVGVSAPTVSARIGNLESLGILSGYRAVVDPERLGQTRFVLVVSVRPPRSDGVRAGLAAMSEVRWTVHAQGDRVIAEVVTDEGSVESLVRRVEGLDGVVRCERHPVAPRDPGPPRVVIADRASTVLDCFECGRRIEGEPVRIKLDGRAHYLCCTSCESLYRARYARIRSAAVLTRRTSGRGAPVRTGASP